MKTVKALKITSILNGIFCFFCVASTVCFAITRYCDSNLFFSIGNILIFGWIINPVGIVSFAVCLSLFLSERKNQEAKEVIGRKWVWIFVWPIITTLLYLVSSILTVAFTGGV